MEVNQNSPPALASGVAPGSVSPTVSLAADSSPDSPTRLSSLVPGSSHEQQSQIGANVLPSHNNSVSPLPQDIQQELDDLRRIVNNLEASLEAQNTEKGEEEAESTARQKRWFPWVHPSRFIPS